MVRALQAEGCDAFAVARLDELAVLREAGVRACVLMLGGIASDAETAAAVALDATPLVQDAGELSGSIARRNAPARLPVHIEVDTECAEWACAGRYAGPRCGRCAQHLELAGIATHRPRR